MSRPHWLTSAVAAAFFALALAGCPDGAPTPAKDNNPTGSANPAGSTPGEFPDCGVPSQEAAWAAEIVRLVNEQRASAGLNALASNPTLAGAADVEACDMIHYHFFGHTNPVTGSTTAERFTASGYPGNAYGENIAGGQFTPAQVVAEWMNSPGHRENILRPQFTDIGVGIRQGGTYGLYWVQVFGGP